MIYSLFPATPPESKTHSGLEVQLYILNVQDPEATEPLIIGENGKLEAMPGTGSLNLRLKIAQKPSIVWSLGPKALYYESLDP